MKHSDFAIFLILILLVYGGINFLIFSKTRHALAGYSPAKEIVLSILLVWVLAYPVGRITEAVFHGRWCAACIRMGSIYLGIMVYAFLSILFAELVWFLIKVFHLSPPFLINNSHKSCRMAAGVIGLIILVTVISGFINARFLRVRSVDLAVNKEAGPLKGIRIAMVSDLHLGTLIHGAFLNRMVEKINLLDPDLILLVGDLVDEDIGDGSSQDLIRQLQRLRSRWGVYAVTGNHEYYAGVERAVRFIEAGKVTVLQDSIVTISDGLRLVGRKDRTSDTRKPLKSLLEKSDPRLPVIVMDHQPIRLDEAAEGGIDLQISGHTHHGQIFPFNLITKAVYEMSWGILRKDNTQFYVSCGAGTWGPPIRIGSVPEIVEIRVAFSARPQP